VARADLSAKRGFLRTRTKWAVGGILMSRRKKRSTVTRGGGERMVKTARKTYRFTAIISDVVR